MQPIPQGGAEPQAEARSSLLEDLKAQPVWLLWRSVPNPDPTKKARKVPCYASGRNRRGALDGPEDRAQLVVHALAIAAYEQATPGTYAGLGIALGPDGRGGCWQGIDLDGIVAAGTTDVADLWTRGPCAGLGYVEPSPSGNGLHLLGYGRSFQTLGANTSGIEAYAGEHFFTFTGKPIVRDSPCLPYDLAEYVEVALSPRHVSVRSRAANDVGAVRIDAPTVADLRSALFYLRSDDRSLWINMGMALKQLSEVGRGMWIDWSATSDKFDPKDAARTWDSLEPRATGYKAVFAEAMRQGWHNPRDAEAIRHGAEVAAAFERSAEAGEGSSEQPIRAEASALQSGRRSPEPNDDGALSDYVLPRPELRPVALLGVLGEMVEAACARSEAVPSTVALHILARFAVTLNRTAYIQIGDEQRHLRMNALIVGPTSKGRKGTSAEMPRRLFRLVEEMAGYEPTKQLTALATGEGLIHQVRDAYHDHEGKLVDPGVSDKRLFCDISEFAGVLAQARREAATISTVLRDAFDGVKLTIPTKTSFNEATDTHIVVIGSVPETEIVKTLTSTDITNGLANRFPMFYSVRTKSVAFPQPTDAVLMQQFAHHILTALNEGSRLNRVGMSKDALKSWSAVYADLEDRSHPPAVAALLARQSTYTLIFAALIALLNRRHEIETIHLDSALAWVQYWEDTVLFVFSNGAQNETAIKMKALKNDLVDLIAKAGGSRVTHSDIASKVTNKYQKPWPRAADVKAAVELLQRESPPRIYSETVTTQGRPTNVYSLRSRRGG